jgi:hypothetical protein
MNSEITKETVFGKLTGNTATAIFTADSATFIRSIQVCENAGSTPNLTIDIFDGTTAYLKRRALAVTAGTEILYTNEFMLPQGWSIRLTSSDAAGKFDWSVTHDDAGSASRN